MTEKPATIVALTQQGRPTDQATKDEAFRLWIELGRSWTAVSNRCGIPVRTLHYWGESEQWEQRRLDLARSFMPGKKVETAVALRLAAYSAAVKLQQLANDSLELGTKLDHREIDALTKIAYAGGYSPTGNRNPVDGSDSIGDDQRQIPDFDNMTIQELRTYELSIRKRKHQV